MEVDSKKVILQGLFDAENFRIFDYMDKLGSLYIENINCTISKWNGEGGGEFLLLLSIIILVYSIFLDWMLTY